MCEGVFHLGPHWERTETFLRGSQEEDFGGGKALIVDK